MQIEGFSWKWKGHESSSEIKRTFRSALNFFNTYSNGPDAVVVRRPGFSFWVNTPWVSLGVCWGAEEQNHNFLRDGITFSWGRNKGWSSGKSVESRSFYKHVNYRLSRLRVNPVFGNPDGVNLRQFNLEMTR